VQHPLASPIATYIQQRAEVRLEKLDKELKKHLDTGKNESEIKAQEMERFTPQNWLTDAAKRAGQIKLVTHALKYTHTEAKGSSVFSDGSQSKEMSYLHTALLHNPTVDVVGNAAALDVAGLLRLTVDNQSLYECLANNDASPLQSFAESDEQLNEWLSGFRQVFEVAAPASHKLAKQTYFPCDGNGYHLLGVLFSSTLAQAIHGRIGYHRFSEDCKALREQRKKGLYSPQSTIDFPGLAVQTFGGTKPQNVSQLNSMRGGKTYLFSCQPPRWQSQRKPPLTQFAFWRRYTRQVLPTVKQLVKFLRRVGDFKDVRIREQRADFVNTLIERFIRTGAEIIALHEQRGWSVHSSISDAEKFWLDPYREDDAFQTAKNESNWRDDIAKQFADWFNRQLRYYKFNVASPEHSVWRKEVNEQLRKDMEGFSG
jgi:CRISPR-associated protein Csy1